MKRTSVITIFLSSIIGLASASPIIVGDVSAMTSGKVRLPELECIAYFEENSKTGAPVIRTEKKELFDPQQAERQAQLPKRYSLVDRNESTPVRNQGNHGTCWSFGMLASLESNMIKNRRADKNVDLSERHLTWFTYNPESDEDEKSLSSDDKFAGLDHWHTTNLGNPYSNGGNKELVSSTLARGFGALDESKAKYSGFISAALPGHMAGLSDYRMKNFDYLPEIVEKDVDEEDNITYRGTKQEAISTLKKTLMQKGAVAVAFHQTDRDDEMNAYFNEKNGAFYCYKDRWANHEVCIVGWDDNYSRKNFKDDTVDGEIPPADGAFIVKNSWGKNWGNEGYFYLSYYDHSLTEPVSLQGEDTKYHKEDPVHEFDRAYQYDGIGFGDFTYASSKPFKQANVFKMHKPETIQAVGITTKIADSHIDVKLYKNGKNGKPESGTLIGEKHFIQHYPGYHTVSLDTPVDVPTGERITAVFSGFHMEGNQKKWDVMLEATTDVDISNFHGYGECKKGQTYINRVLDRTSHVARNNEAWSDVTKVEPLNEVVNNYDTPVKLGNATIKLLTNTHNSIQGNIKVPKEINLETGKKKAIQGRVLVGDSTLSYKVKKGNAVSVTSKGILKGIRPGYSVIQVELPSTMKCDGIIKTIRVIVKPAKCSNVRIKKNIFTAKTKITWKKMKDVSGYQVKLSKSKNAKKHCKIINVSSGKQKKGIKVKRRKYKYVSIRAYKKVGEKRIYGRWTGSKRIK